MSTTQCLGATGLWRIMLGTTSNDHSHCHYSNGKVATLSSLLFLIPLLIHLAFLHSYIPHQDMWELKISFTALQDQVHYPSPLFALSCYGAISTQLWLLCVDMWYHMVPSKGYKQERWYQPLLWPSVWGRHLKLKHIPSLISPSSSEHQNSFPFLEWQKLRLC